VAWGVRRRIDAGQATDTGSRRAARTGAALRVSGTTASTRAAASGRDGDGHGQSGDVGLRGEVSLAHLLAAAGVVDLDDLDVRDVVEVGHPGVVEGQMTVLADAEAAQVQGWEARSAA